MTPPAGGMVAGPERLSVPTCIGCGAMSRFGSCELGCSEQRLDLVRAVAYDALIAAEPAARARAEVLRPVVEKLSHHQPRTGDFQARYLAVQADARDALRSAPTVDEPGVDVREPAQSATTWWCAECGGIDAPQPCLGICVWREVEWVRNDAYERRREEVLAVLETERRAGVLLRRLAWATPREGHWERSWQALLSEAQQITGASASAAESPQGTDVP